MSEGSVTVTVLLPVYNCADFVSKAIESVLKQTYLDYELLIIDDGSDDQTPSILEEAAERSNRVRVLRHSNRGVGFTLNRGISEARGELVAELGADDIALPQRLEQQVRFLKSNPDHVLVGSSLRIIDSGGQPIGIRRYPTDNYTLRRRLPLYNPFGSPSLMYRRADALYVGGYTSRFKSCEDYDFVLRVATRGKVANLPEPLTCYRLHAGATKARQTVLQVRDTIRIREAAFNEYGYRRTAETRFVSLLQSMLAFLPPRLIYWLFRRIAIRKLGR